ncbi:MAG: hypothetical protein PF442_08325 [Desulfobulbaceae bacterium]|jgi:hypothetical protein|nr:hypothetical protein [Desulfobulbaceae bacterium]
MANDYARFTYDDDLEMKAAGLLAASADGSILDLGEGLFDGFLVVDMSACEIDGADEVYTVSVEGSTVAAMTSESVCLAKKVFGNLVVPMDDALSAAGRYVVPFRNEDGGELQRYVRLSTLVAGVAVATGINFSAFLAKR